MLKCCSKCHIEKPLTEFYHNCNTSDGHHSECKVCGAKWAKENGGNRYDPNRREYFNWWRERNRDRSREIARLCYAKGGEKSRQRSINCVENYRAKKKGNGGSHTVGEWLTLRDFVGVCLRCGSKEKLTPDHVVPVALGGSSDIENIQPLCLACNMSKGATIKDYRPSWFW